MNMQSLLQVVFLQIITTGRLTSIMAGVIGLISVVIGRMAVARSARRISSGRPMAIVALVVALASMLLSVMHLASTTGGFGTGKGRAGAIVALVIGLIGMVLGGRALARSKRITQDA
jgi:membrane associated rhomboid family serine protease